MGVLVAFVAVYVGVLAVYGHSAQSEVVDRQDFSGDINFKTDLLVVLAPSAVKPSDGAIPAHMQILPPASLTDDAGALLKPIDVVMPSLANGSVKFEKGTTQLTVSVDIMPFEGNYQAYPFDTYAADLVTNGYAINPDGRRIPLRTVLGVGGSAPGWDVENAPIEGLGDSVFSATELSVARAWSTKAIVLLLLFAMVILAVTGLLVARSVVTRRRRIEATMASWFAALLFAVIPLRTNMPGSPPMGVWIDFVAVLWVELALMGSLAVFVVSWLRFTPRPA
jgi:Domain of unknown function (DUF4436)